MEKREYYFRELRSIEKPNDIKVNLYCCVLFFILAFGCNLFYLIDSEKFPFVREISSLLILFLAIATFLRFPKASKSKNSFFLFVEIGVITLSFTSSIESYFLYGQPFVLGLRAQRNQIIFPLLFFSLSVLTREKKIESKSIIKVLFTFSITEIFIGIIQAILFNYVIFTYTLTGFRYGGVRLYMNGAVISCMFFISLNNFFKKPNFKDFIYILLVFVFYTLITKGRMSILMLFFSTFLASFCFSKIDIRTKFFILFLTFSFFYILSFFPLGNDLLDIILSGGDSDTSYIREVGGDFYLSVLEKHLLLGGGFINTSWMPSVTGSMYDKNITWVDNGIVGYAFYYGSLGLAFIFAIYAYFILTAFKVYKLEGDFSYLSYLIYTLIGCRTLFLLGMKDELVFPVFCYLIYESSLGIKNILHAYKTLLP
jgi:hypothetical protein